MTMIFKCLSSWRDGFYTFHIYGQVNYNNTLLFPSIAICNQNDFRKTRAHEENIYDLVGKITTPTVKKWKTDAY